MIGYGLHINRVYMPESGVVCHWGHTGLTLQNNEKWYAIVASYITKNGFTGLTKFPYM